MALNLKYSSILPQNLDKEYPLIVKGEGCYLIDDSGQKYLDGAAGGVSACSIGHGVSEVIDAMGEQAKKIAYANLSLFTNEPQLKLAENLVKFAPDSIDRVYFVSTGTEATELCVKLAQNYHRARGNNTKTRVIGRWHCYHGSSFGALAYSGRSSRRQTLTPYFFPATLINAPYCYRCPYGKTYPECGIACAWELEKAIKQEGPNNISIFIAEPIINTIAAVTPPPEYFKIIRDICDRYDVIFAVDEVITGFGRTGRNFGIEHWDVAPDLIATGKGIAGGYAPLAAALISNKVTSVLLENGGQTVVGYTYAGNPLSCSAGVAVNEYICKNSLVENARKVGNILQEEAKKLLDLPMVGDVRGKALMLGVEFVADKNTKEPFPRSAQISEKVHSECWKRGLSYCPLAGDADGISGDAASIGPALILNENQARDLVKIFGEAVVAVADNI